MNREYYKIVRHDPSDPGVFRSIYTGPYSVEYSPDEVTRPHPDLPNSRLFVFNSIEDAEDFLPDINEEIWEVECEDVVPITHIARFTHILEKEPEWLDKMWADKGFSQKAPKRTYGAKSVKLVNRIPFIWERPKSDED